MDLNLTRVAAFLVLVEERHFGRTAERLHLTTSAVSKRISGLEKDLGVALVVRDHAGELTLTRAGSRFVGPAAAVIQQATAATRAARAVGTGPTLLIGATIGNGTLRRRRPVVSVGPGPARAGR